MSEPAAPAPDQDWVELDFLLRGFQVSRMLRLVADLGVADRIAPDRSIEVDRLAADCGVLAEPLLRVLRALAAFRIFSIESDGTVSHTPRSRLLRTDTPNNLYHAARFWTARGSWRAWEKLDAAMSGGVPHEAAWNMSRFAYLDQNPEEARIFDAMMEHFPDNRHAAVAASYDFSPALLIVDVGGGNGAALRHILERYPTPRGLVFDRTDVVNAVSDSQLTQGRISLQGGSFFDGVPPGGDHYLIIRVLHDWGDEDCRRILRACRVAMDKNAVLLIGEQILEPDPTRGRPSSYLIDVQMLAMFGSARERSEAEFRHLLAASGFAVRRIIPTQSPTWIIEATPT